MKNQEFVIIIHNVRSAYNVGSIFRTADAAGVSKIYLTGYTPQPVDLFGRTRKDIVKQARKNIAKTALGAEDLVSWEHYKEISKIIKHLKKEGFYIVALEQSPKSLDYKKINPKQKTALIVGNEVRGLSKSVLGKCDDIVEIPMRGKKESLNVSVSLGVALFRILNI